MAIFVFQPKPTEHSEAHMNSVVSREVCMVIRSLKKQLH